MSIEEARLILADSIVRVPPPGTELLLYNSLNWIMWRGETKASLDGDFSADQLEAIAVFMKHHKESNELHREDKGVGAGPREV